MPTLALPNTGLGNVSYEERPGSPEESAQDGQFRVRRTFLTSWADRWKFCMGMMGYPRVFRNTDVAGNFINTGYYVSRVLPRGYRTRDIEVAAGGQAGVSPWIYPVSVESIKGVGKILSYDQDDQAVYAKAEVSLGYSTVLYGMRTDQEMIDGGFSDTDDNPDEGTLGRFVSKFQQPTAEYLTLPFGGLNWCQTGSRIPVVGSQGKIVPSQEVMFLWHQVPALPSDLGRFIGSVNSATFPESSFTNDTIQYDRGTLLLTSIEIKPYRWFLGQRLYDITYKMKYFQPKTGVDARLDASLPNAVPPSGQPLNEPYGHNHFLRYVNFQVPLAGNIVNPPVYQMMTHNAYRPTDPLQPGQTVYPYKDFGQLFVLSNVPKDYR